MTRSGEANHSESITSELINKNRSNHSRAWVGILVLCIAVASCGGSDKQPKPTPASVPTPIPSPTPSSAPTPDPDSPVDLTLYNGLDKTDKDLLARVSKTFKVSRESSEVIWNSKFRVDKDILYLVRKDKQKDLRGFLFNHPRGGTISGAQVLDVPAGMNLGTVVYFQEANHKGLSSIANFEFDYSLADESVFVMKYTDEAVDSFSAPISNAWIEYFVHEVFHRYQSGNVNSPMGNQSLVGYVFSAEAIALILLEHRVLRGGLQSAGITERDAALHQFLAIRNLRMERYGKGKIDDLDNVQEMIEGTARYIEMKLQPLLDSKAKAMQNLLEELEVSEKMLDDLKAKDRVKESYGFNRFYASGAAIGALLDRQNITWIAKLESGSTLYKILLDHYGVENRATLIENAKALYKYDELIPLSEKAAKKAESEPDSLF